jgi:hypothetical protein
LCDPWIEPLLGHKFISPAKFQIQTRFFLCLFKKKRTEGKFVLSPIVEVVGYFNLKKINTTRKSAKTIEKWEKNSKIKSVEVEEEVCNSN